MANQQQQQGENQGYVPFPAVPARITRAITPRDMVLAYEDTGERVPLPRNAPEEEGTIFTFHKVRDATGSDLGDLIKRSVFNKSNLVGDKRRQILGLLPMTKKNKGELGRASNELDNLNAILIEKIGELVAVTGVPYNKPAHFAGFPALKK